MFAASKTDSVSGAAPDGQFNYVTMLLHGDGTNGAQNNTFLDSSTNNFTITRNGNTTQGSFSPYGSNWSNYFDGSGDYLTCSVSVPATGAFTVEMFVFPTSTAGYQLLFSQFTSGNAGSLQILWDDTADKFTVNIGTGTVLTSSSTYALSTWHHLAITRDGSNNMTMWVNGASAATTTNSTSILQTTTYIASRSALDGYFNGYISNLRVTNTAVYTTSFTPSTTPLTAISGTQLLTCADNRFIDDSASPKTITVNGNTSVQRFNPFGTSTAYSTSVIGGSGYFDGNGDYLNAPNNTAFQIGTGDFTYECWLYPTNLGGSQKIGFVTGSSGGFGFGLWTNTIQYGLTDIANVFSFTASGMINNQWIHFAVSRASGTMHSYVNGVRVDSRSNSTNFSSYDKASIGGYYDGSQGFTGYISDAKFTKGTGVYTGTTLTVPTAPVSAGSCTLLCSMTNGAIFDNAMMNDLETVGNAQISTSVKKYGTGSLYFDGSGDYLSGPTMPTTALGSGAYTVEFWLYKDSTGTGERGIFQTQTASLYGLSIFADGTTIYIDERTNTFSGTDPRISGTISQDTWIHVAVCRQTGTSGTLRAFVNGTQIGSSVTSGLRNLTSTGPIIVGNTAPASNPFKGYIDDLRITNGYARYTATFTPPTAAFSDIGPY